MTKYNCKTRSIFAIIFCIVILSPSCRQSAPGAGTEEQPEIGFPDKDIPRIEVLFDESAGVASSASNFYFLFDMSGSMEEKCSGRRKIDGAKQAVTSFMKNIPDSVNIGLILFGTGEGNGVIEALPIASGNKEKFLDIINGLEPTGKTPLGEAILSGVDKMVEQYKKQLGYGTYRIIVITDGEQTGIGLKQPCNYLAGHGFIGLYSIGLCMESYHTLKKYSLSYRDANNYEELEDALIEATAESDVFDATLFEEELYKADTTSSERR